MVAMFVCLPILLLTSYFFGRVLVRPLVESEPAVRPPVQFFITDMYVLMLQLMLMGSAIFAHATESDREQHLLVLFPTWAIQGWWWWLGVRRLSRARVASRLRRAVFLGVAVPFAFGNFFLLAVLIPLYQGSSSSGSEVAVLAAFLLILFMVFEGCRRLAEWTAAEPPKRKDEG